MFAKLPKCFPKIRVFDLQITELGWVQNPKVPVLNFDEMCKTTKEFERFQVKIDTFAKKTKLAINSDRYTNSDLKIPLKYIKLDGYNALFFHESVLEAFQNLKTLKITNAQIVSQTVADRYIDLILNLMPRLTNLKLCDIYLTKKRNPCDFQRLLAQILLNKSIENLSLINLQLGLTLETRTQIADLFLYNETL